MGTLIPGEIETFVRDRQASASNYHRLLRAFFGHARRHRWIDANPFEELGSAPSSDWEAKDLMTPAQFAGLLKIAAGMEDGYPRREPLLAAFVLGGLAGLRTAELRRLTWEKLDLKTGVISLDRETTRKRGLRGRKVQLELAALKWLRTLKKGEPGERVVGLSEKNFREARATIREAAKIDVWSHNILRRSFASHHLARFEDGAKTAATMGHTDAETTFAKYRVPATRKAGKAWFALTPEKVESMKV
jgi:integrase